MTTVAFISIIVSIAALAALICLHLFCDLKTTQEQVKYFKDERDKNSAKAQQFKVLLQDLVKTAHGLTGQYTAELDAQKAATEQAMAESDALRKKIAEQASDLNDKDTQLAAARLALKDALKASTDYKEQQNRIYSLLRQRLGTKFSKAHSEAREQAARERKTVTNKRPMADK